MELVIIDLGRSMEATNAKTGERNPKYDVNRYGVWEVVGGVATRVIDSSNKLDYLLAKFGKLDVVSIKKGGTK